MTPARTSLVIQPRQRSVESDLLKIILIQLGATLADVSRQTGISSHTLYTQISRSWPSVRCRLKVEHCPGIERAIWSSSKEYSRRVAQAQMFGFIPQLASWKTLRNLAIKTGMPGYNYLRRREDLIREIERHLNAKNKSQSPRPSTPPPAIP